MTVGSSRYLAAAIAIVVACFAREASGVERWELSSPDGRLQVRVEPRNGISYSVRSGETPVVAPSQVDLKVAGSGWLGKEAKEITADENSREEMFNFVVPRKYRQRKVAYKELALELGDKARLVFRAYNDGVAYRWETSLADEITVDDELAEFNFPGDPQIWFPEEETMQSHQERVYKHEALADIGANRFCSTGTLVDLGDGRKVYISESDLRSYPGMYLRGAGERRAGLVGKYAPFPLETYAKNDRDVIVTKPAPYLAKTVGTRTFPWRVMIISERDADLVQSELIHELGQPLAIEDPSWIKPGKVAWDWWNGIDITGVEFRAGINTATYQHFIDFAAEYHIEYVLLDEGWTASTSDILHENRSVDLPEIVRYGKEKGVGVVLWVLWNALDANLEEALDRFEKLGVAGIKVDFMQRDDQWMIEYYHRVAREAAARHLLVDFHGACKPFGLNRPYPNVLTSEGVCGLEQYKWTDKHANPPQELLYPFIRMVAGPLDYTPGAMRNATRDDYRSINEHPMSLGTRCHQLAMYVVYESPLQMLADSPTRYRKEPECMKFLSAVPTVWDDTIVVDAKAGEHIAIARRSGDDWFVGAMTNWDPREFDIKLDFLPAGEFEIDTWSDGINATRNAEDFRCSTEPVTADSSVKVKMAPGGGWVGWIHPADSRNR
ncbi:MAG: glycoside hydrolase family 97 protein [Pirellulales bacterium]